MERIFNRSLLINFLIAAITLILQFNGPVKIGTFSFIPIFPIAFVVVVSMYSTELKSFIIGLIIGIFVDSSSSALFSFNTVAYPIIALFVSLLIHYLFNRNIRSCIVVSFFSTAVLLFSEFVVTYFSLGFNNMLKNFLNSIIPSSILTVMFAILLFFIENKIYKTTG